ncbi:MAG: hypothetical protein ACRDAQ_00925 [Cetobacterium sp.]
MTELEKQKRIETNKKLFKIMGKMGKVVGGVFVFCVLVSFLGSRDESNNPKEKVTVKEKVKYDIKDITPFIRSDMSAHAVYYYLKDNLTDSSGFEIISTSAVFELSNSMFLQHVTFKAKNNFGVLIKKDVSFIMEGTGFDSVVVIADTRDNVEKFLSDKNIVLGKGYRKTESIKIEKQN